VDPRCDLWGGNTPYVSGRLPNPLPRRYVLYTMRQAGSTITSGWLLHVRRHGCNIGTPQVVRWQNSYLTGSHSESPLSVPSSADYRTPASRPSACQADALKIYQRPCDGRMSPAPFSRYGWIIGTPHRAILAVAMENHLFEITRSVDWPASIRALREMSRDPASWAKALADDGPIAWSRLLGCCTLFPDVEGHPAGEILREHLDALSAEVRRRPRVRNLAGLGHVRTVEEETRPPSARTKARRRAATRLVVAELGKVGVAPPPEALTGALEFIAQDRTAARETSCSARATALLASCSRPGKPDPSLKSP
jgi:hypothetical protein